MTMPRGAQARKRRSERRGSDATGVSKARVTAATTNVLIAAGDEGDVPAEAELREATDPAFACGACASFDSKTGICGMWDATVDADDTCDFFVSAKAQSEAAVLPPKFAALAREIAEHRSITLEEAHAVLATQLEGFGGKPSPGTKKDKRLKENDAAAAASGACANCDHAFDDHAGDDNMGACSVGSCDCQGFEQRSYEEKASNIQLDADGFLQVTAGLAPEQAALVRLRLANFELHPLAADDMEDTLPTDHKPGSKTPPRRRGAQTPKQPLSSNAMAWTATFVPEAKLTDDGRAMAPDSITWRDVPLTLMAMTETSEGGHIGAEVCGRIDSIWRDTSNAPANLIRASGMFDGGEYGQEICRMVDERVLSGVSVDLAIHEYEVGPRSNYFDENGNWAPKEKDEQKDEPSILDLLFGDADEEATDPTIFVVTNAVIGMCTVCPFPAFADAKIEVGSSLVAASNPAIVTVTCQAGFVMTDVPHAGAITADKLEDGVVASVITAAAAGIAPTKPPAEWFQNPALEEPTALTIDSDGRVYGHAWLWGSCHTAIFDACTTPPHSEHDYAYFLLGETECEDGERISTGKITMDGPHAGRGLGRADATAHYDNTCTVVCDITVGEDEHGGWFAGAVRPDASAEKVRALRGAALSGDWRRVSTEHEHGNLELVALLCVNVPGFPVPRTSVVASAAADGEAPQVLTLIAAGVNTGMPPASQLTDEQKAELVALARSAAQSVEDGKVDFTDAFVALRDVALAAAE